MEGIIEGIGEMGRIGKIINLNSEFIKVNRGKDLGDKRREPFRSHLDAV